jgi:hypothetical protein
VLCFIAQTREYLLGKLRKGKSMTGIQTADFIHQIKTQLPGCVKKVLLRADGEFLSSHGVQAAIDCGFDFIIANKGCEPPFDPDCWYRPFKRKDYEFNSCVYQLKTLAANTIRIARLKLLFIAAIVVKDQNRDKVKYSIHDARTPAMVELLARLDSLRSKPRPWAQNDQWPQRFAFEI